MKRDYWHWGTDFFGTGSLSTSENKDGLVIADTSSSGTPTYAHVDGSEAGELAVDLASTNEIENVCVYMGDKLQFDIDKIVEAWFRVKLNQAALDATTMFAIGLTGDRNDAIDSIAQAILFRVIGADDTTALVVESDDGTNDNNDVATGKTLTNSYAEFLINFERGKDDVRLFHNDQPIATGTKFDLSNYAGSLQFFAQIQKTADTNVDGFTLDAAEVHGRRTLVA